MGKKRLISFTDDAMIEVISRLNNPRDGQPLRFDIDRKFYHVRRRPSTSGSRYMNFSLFKSCFQCSILANLLALEYTDDVEVLARDRLHESGCKHRCEFCSYPRFANFNLYAVDNSGREILMTRDHIIPVSKGGENTMWNIQMMCAPCNEAKSDTMPDRIRLAPVPMSPFLNIY